VGQASWPVVQLIRWVFLPAACHTFEDAKPQKDNRTNHDRVRRHMNQYGPGRSDHRSRIKKPIRLIPNDMAVTFRFFLFPSYAAGPRIFC
jgi:hypothetical protein